MISILVFCQRVLKRLLVLVVLILPMVSGIFAEEPPLRIPRVSRPPKLSDFINGMEREAEAVVTVFKQYDPHDGEPLSQPTAAYLSYDSKNLYVGWICKDDPDKIRARVAPRKQIDSDDRVTINIDTFQDHKHAYWFDVNPYGIQYEGRETDGAADDSSWETLWYSEGKITQDGYVVLQTIPFRSIRFPRGPRQVWNICLGRFIERTNELAMWPFVTHQRSPQFVGQFAPIELDADISPGRNMQFIPYGLYSYDKTLDTSSGYQRHDEHHPGLDAKAVLHDSLTFDLAVNPDFSEIGSDDPQVQVNQRYEVIYPERRPFFLENSSIFAMPEELFLSQHIVNPQVGAKLSGSVGRWGLGAVVADDRSRGEVLGIGKTGRAMDEVFRTEREFGHESHVGLFLSNTDFQSTLNRVGSIDLRYLWRRNWALKGQASTTQTRDISNNYTAGPGYELIVSKNDNNTSFSTSFLDRSPGMNTTLGYLSRSDIRYWDNYYSYRWKPPANQTLLSWGPSLDASLTYDHEQRLENWVVTPSFSLTLKRQTSMSMSHQEAYELYEGIGFRERYTKLYFATAWYNWLEMNASYEMGQQPNYYPADGVSSFVGNSGNGAATITLRPQKQLLLEGIYYYTRLATNAKSLPAAGLPDGDVFTNHLIRSKVNYQFTRDYAFRAIFDYNSLLPNNALVSTSYSKQADTTLLFTYLPHPGTAFYLGYADTFQNVNYDASETPAYTITSIPETSTDRQLFVKFSYLFRF